MLNASKIPRNILLYQMATKICFGTLALFSSQHRQINGNSSSDIHFIEVSLVLP